MSTIATTSTPDGTYDWFVSEVSISPDYQWVARASYRGAPDCEPQYTSMMVMNADHTVVWQANHEWQFPDCQVSPFPHILSWSSSGQYLYYSIQTFIGGCATFTNGGDLWRLDLARGDSIQLVPDVAYILGTWLSVSPDDTILAYPPDVSGDEVIFRELATGRERSFALVGPAIEKAHRIGHIVWSPDAHSVAFTVAFNPCDPTGATPFTSAIGIADTELLSASFLPLAEDEGFVTAAWTDDTGLVLISGDRVSWRYELNDGSITPYDWP